MLNKLYSSHRNTIKAFSQHRIEMFGPLDIKNHKEFLKESKEFFKAWSTSQFPYKLDLSNFLPLYDLGMGAFGRVILVKYKHFEKSYYAMKIMNKQSIVDAEIADFALNEKRVLQGLNCPFTIRLEYFTTDSANLYYLLPFITGGELLGVMQKQEGLSENLAKFYAGQIILALEFLHYCDIIHRDLKPENVLIDHFGYLKIADFGFAKVLKEDRRTYTFCGTPDYIAPEIILGLPYSFAADWWATGVMLFEMVSASSPFFADEQIDLYANIVDVKYTMPQNFSKELKDLISNLLQRDVTMRLGNLKGGAEDIKKHAWLKEISWLNLFNRRIVPPYLPPNPGNFDTANFPRLKPLSKNFSITRSKPKASDYDKVFESF